MKCAMSLKQVIRDVSLAVSSSTLFQSFCAFRNNLNKNRRVSQDYRSTSLILSLKNSPLADLWLLKCQRFFDSHLGFFFLGFITVSVFQNTACRTLKTASPPTLVCENENVWKFFHRFCSNKSKTIQLSSKCSPQKRHHVHRNSRAPHSFTYISKKILSNVKY